MLGLKEVIPIAKGVDLTTLVSVGIVEPSSNSGSTGSPDRTTYLYTRPPVRPWNSRRTTVLTSPTWTRPVVLPVWSPTGKQGREVLDPKPREGSRASLVYPYDVDEGGTRTVKGWTGGWSMDGPEHDP